MVKYVLVFSGSLRQFCVCLGKGGGSLFSLFIFVISLLSLLLVQVKVLKCFFIIFVR